MNLMKIKNTLLAVVSLCLAFTVTNARADIVLSNTNAAPHSALNRATSSDWYATPFTVDASSDYTIGAIALTVVVPEVSGSHGLVGEIRTNNGGAPGVWVEDLSINGGIPGGETTFLNFNATPATLSAGTSYFFVFGVEPLIANYFDFSISTDKTADIGSTWAQGDGYYESIDGGSAWTSQTTYQTRLSIDAIAIPEPSVLALIGITGLGTLVGRRLMS